MNRIFGACLFFCFASAGLAQESVGLTLAQVATRVSDNNYTVLENAQKLYQAKKNIEVARGELLPKLNLWKVISNVVGAIFDPVSLIESTQDIAPFLAPNNWFRLEETKILFLAEKEGYRALWGNELLTAKTLYLQVLLDRHLRDAIETSVTRFVSLEHSVTAREHAGNLPLGSSKEIRIKRLALESDLRELRRLVAQETASLTFALGYPNGTVVEFGDVPVPNFENLTALSASDFVFRVLDNSPERRQHEQFIAVIPLIKKEIRFSWLGSSTTSRGAAGGVFDSIPVPDGLGFGSGASVEIAAAQEARLRLQKLGIEETLKRNLDTVVGRYNSSLEDVSNVTERLKLANELWLQVDNRLRLGDEVEFVQIVNAAESVLGMNVVFDSHGYGFRMNEQRLARLLFHADYYMKPAMIEEIKGRAVR